MPLFLGILSLMRVFALWKYDYVIKIFGHGFQSCIGPHPEIEDLPSLTKIPPAAATVCYVHNINKLPKFNTLEKDTLPFKKP